MMMDATPLSPPALLHGCLSVCLSVCAP
ncbi:unnamed protein product [Ectocarpus sp. CCAP 1310/34]|nr:unnamed protein product [Ectocarpus sp. CCAP 1310/34]